MTDRKGITDEEGGATGRLPDLAIESFARGFFREAITYGFSQVDFVRFVNEVLSISMASERASSPEGDPESEPPPGRHSELPLSDDLIQVRRFDPASDMKTLSRWMGDPKGRLFLLEGTMTRWRTLEEVARDEQSVLGMITLPDGEPIGATAFLDIREDQKKAEMRKLIGEPQMRGRGFAKAATRLWIGYGFGTLGLRKIYINTLDTNIRNIRLNEALGFQLEGILRDEVVLDGSYRDVLRMAIWRI